MKPSPSGSCLQCRQRCDLFLTAREMGLEEHLQARQVHYRRHEHICRQHEMASRAIVLLSGNAKMFIEGLNGRNIILNILLPSNYIGLMAVIGNHPYPYSVSALSPAITCHVDLGTIRKMYEANPGFMLSLNDAFCHSVNAIMAKLISLNQKQLRGKMADSLLYLSKLYESRAFDLSLTRKELGELSAISEENAVRILTEYKNEGIISLEGRRIELLDMETLSWISANG